MFKKLKDKLAEEVKSSPQRIQQFAQAAQAAVTSASSSISDITNSDLFSIGDNESQPNHPVKTSPSEHKNTFQEVNLVQPSSIQASTDSMDFASSLDMTENQRQRRLSNSSFASDVSFRLPSYESPSMYHLQSDVEVSASEADERGFSSGNVSLDRVTKEQIYSAYRRTQDRYTKYRTQYADLARHYKLLERENAKAKSVLVETQDKALRRISELREQCALEQSAKAHLEKALRIEIEEKNLKIDTLDTKIKLLQSNGQGQEQDENTTATKDNENNVQLISFEGENKSTNNVCLPSEVITLSNKVEKLEKLVNKYKESLKTTKEKNAQLMTETKMLSTEIGTKNKEIEQLKTESKHLTEAKHRIQELNDLNEELQNKVNVYDFNKNKELETLEIDLQKAQEEIAHFQTKIQVFTKREEEYAISLAENKLSIHKELESKEAEIKSLNDLLSESKEEINSLNILLNDYKNNTISLENECSNLKNDVSQLDSSKAKINELNLQIQTLTQKYQLIENAKSKADEEYKCLQLQLKQETAEKLAMIDRNVYLENRNLQLSEENTKKTLQINTLDEELYTLKKDKETVDQDNSNKTEMTEQIDIWKNKCSILESEIQEERDELVKLQTEIEKLLTNDESLQIQNTELNSLLDKLKSENEILQKKQSNSLIMKTAFNALLIQIKEIQKKITLTSHETKLLKELSYDEIKKLKKHIDNLMEKHINMDEFTVKTCSLEVKRFSEEYDNIVQELNSITEENFKLKSDINNKDLKNNELDVKLQRIHKEYELTLNELQLMRNDKEQLEKLLKEVEGKCKELQKTIDLKTNEEEALKLQITNMTETIGYLESGDESLKNENHKLKQQLEKFVEECLELQHLIEHKSKEITSLKQKNDDMAKDIDNLKSGHLSSQNEKQKLEQKLDDMNTKCQELHHIIDSTNNEQEMLKHKLINIIKQYDESKAECKKLHNIIEENNKDKQISNMDRDKLKCEYQLQNDKVEELNKAHTENIQQLNQIKQHNSILLEKLQHYEDNQNIIEKLQQSINDLTQENISLKRQSEEITNSIKKLEIELCEVRKSHTEMEIEKDHLNSVIQLLEKTEREKELFDKDTQTINNTIETFEELNLAGELSVSQKSPSNKNDTYQSLAYENDMLKEENKRLQSDVTGLQTYLAQISKENSLLNDKLREVIRSSENSTEYQNLKSEILIGKEKLDDLIRENSLLAEENLELKDQLNSQHYAHQAEIINTQDHGKDNSNNFKEKYTNLLDMNSQLQNRMVELEQMNRSINGSMSQMQENNEKLRLTNDKLERRLDEALVSLRHLHSLQENTELEYLRNILYEYLTGTGAHSVTLAKVLAAVVKFDQTQTEQILLKEKERQGFLRQLGLL